MSNPYDTAAGRTSVLGPTIQFKGELSADEDLVIQGQVEGTIHHKQRLTVGRDGKVRANVQAQVVVVDGAIDGDVRAAKSVSVSETGSVTGNITAPSVAILPGARFNGSVDMGGGNSGSNTAASSEAPMARRPFSAV
jgi:cytoskeletal protein CcmA (bactofilin family)